MKFTLINDQGDNSQDIADQYNTCAVIGQHVTPERGIVRLEKWNEGYVLWHHGEIVWKSFTRPVENHS